MPADSTTWSFLQTANITIPADENNSPGFAEAVVEGRHNVAKAARRRLAPCSRLLRFSLLRSHPRASSLLVPQKPNRRQTPFSHGTAPSLPARLSAFAPVPSLPLCLPPGARSRARSTIIIPVGSLIRYRGGYKPKAATYTSVVDFEGIIYTVKFYCAECLHNLVSYHLLFLNFALKTKQPLTITIWRQISMP